MKKSILAYILLLSLLSGCAVVDTAVQPVSGQPAVSPSGIAAELPAGSPSPQVSETPAESPPNSETSAQPSPEPPAESSAPPELPEPLSWPVIDCQPLNQVFVGYPDFYGSVLIEKDGTVILYKSYGASDTEAGTLNSPVTKFLIGSVTKQFTAMAVMQLYEKGLLDIHDKLSDYIPDFTRGGDIDLINLLTMTSGIVDYMNESPAVVDEMPYEALSPENIIELIKTKSLKFEPGSKYSYCNTNYLILYMIVEEVSGLSYGDYLAANIFDVLGMENTGVFDINNPPSNMATGHWSGDEPVRYYNENGDVITKNANATAAGYGAGGLYSTVEDLYLWDQALESGKLLSKEYMDMLFTPHVHIIGALIPSDYGFGWIIQTDPDFGTIIEHTGALGGFRAYNAIFAERDIKVIILYNNKEFTGRNKLISDVKQALLAALRQNSNSSQENPARMGYTLRRQVIA